jgi:hypothetical protein
VPYPEWTGLIRETALAPAVAVLETRGQPVAIAAACA